MKCDVLTQLPAKTRTNVVLNKESVKTNLKGLRKAAEEMERDDLKGMEKRGALLKFYAETAMAKQESVLYGNEFSFVSQIFTILLVFSQYCFFVLRDYISDFLESDRERKFLVFAHHAVMLAGISALLTRKVLLSR